MEADFIILSLYFERRLRRYEGLSRVEGMLMGSEWSLEMVGKFYATACIGKEVALSLNLG